MNTRDRLTLMHNVVTSFLNGKVSAETMRLTVDGAMADEIAESTCTRCRREDTDARDVYFPLSDEYIRLCTDCEPDDVAVSAFELFHTSPCHCPFCNQPTDSHAGDCEVID